MLTLLPFPYTSTTLIYHPSLITHLSSLIILYIILITLTISTALPFYVLPLSTSTIQAILITLTVSTTLPSRLSYVLRLAPSPPPLILQLYSSIAHLLSLIYPLSLVPYPESEAVIYRLSSYLIPCHLVSSIINSHHSSSFHLLSSHSLSLLRLSLFFLVSHHQLLVIGCYHSSSNSSSSSYLRHPTQSYLALHFLISLK